MEMTIDEALKVWLPVIQMGVETMPECKEALVTAIDAMHKYQKIEEIIRGYDTAWELHHMKDTIDKIREVVE